MVNLYGAFLKEACTCSGTLDNATAPAGFLSFLAVKVANHEASANANL